MNLKIVNLVLTYLFNRLSSDGEFFPACAWIAGFAEGRGENEGCTSIRLDEMGLISDWAGEIGESCIRYY